MPEVMISSPNTTGGHYASGSETEEHNVAESDSQAGQQDTFNISQGEHNNAASRLIIEELQNTVKKQTDIIEQQQRVMEAQHKIIFEQFSLIVKLRRTMCMTKDTLRKEENRKGSSGA